MNVRHLTAKEARKISPVSFRGRTATPKKTKMSSYEETPDPVLVALKKMGDVNVRALQKIVRLQAQVVTLSEQMIALQAHVYDVPIEEIGKKFRERGAENAKLLSNALGEWLYQNDIATPKGEGADFLDKGE